MRPPFVFKDPDKARLRDFLAPLGDPRASERFIYAMEIGEEGRIGSRELEIQDGGERYKKGLKSLVRAVNTLCSRIDTPGYIDEDGDEHLAGLLCWKDFWSEEGVGLRLTNPVDTINGLRDFAQLVELRIKTLPKKSRGRGEGPSKDNLIEDLAQAFFYFFGKKPTPTNEFAQALSVLWEAAGLGLSTTKSNDHNPQSIEDRVRAVLKEMKRCPPWPIFQWTHEDMVSAARRYGRDIPPEIF